MTFAHRSPPPDAGRGVGQIPDEPHANPRHAPEPRPWTPTRLAVRAVVLSAYWSVVLWSLASAALDWREDGHVPGEVALTLAVFLGLGVWWTLRWVRALRDVRARAASGG